MCIQKRLSERVEEIVKLRVNLAGRVDEGEFESSQGFNQASSHGFKRDSGCRVHKADAGQVPILRMTWSPQDFLLLLF